MLHRFRTKVIFKVMLGSGFAELLRIVLSVLSVFSFISLPKVLFYSAHSLCCSHVPVCTFVKTGGKTRNKAPASANKLL